MQQGMKKQKILQTEVYTLILDLWQSQGLERA